MTLRERAEKEQERKKSLSHTLASSSRPLSSSKTNTHEKLYQSKTINSVSYTSTVKSRAKGTEKDVAEEQQALSGLFDFGDIDMASFYALIKEFGTKCYAARDSKRIA